MGAGARKSHQKKKGGASKKAESKTVVEKVVDAVKPKKESK